LSYEVIRFAAGGAIRCSRWWPAGSVVAGASRPTQPADDQAAVAIHALEGAMALEKSQAAS